MHFKDIQEKKIYSRSAVRPAFNVKLRPGDLSGNMNLEFTWKIVAFDGRLLQV